MRHGSEGWHSRGLRGMWRFFRRFPRVLGLWHSYEKAGLRVSGEPIPWNADTVLVEALVEWSGNPLVSRIDFELRTSDEIPLTPASLEERGGGFYHVLFRLAASRGARAGMLYWRSRPLARVELPYLSRERFLESFQIEVPTFFARFQENCVACRSVVEGQSCDLLASSLLRSPTSLLPLLDFGLCLEVAGPASNRSVSVPLRLAGAELLGREAVLMSALPVRLGAAGSWSISWTVAGQTLVRRNIRVIAREAFLESIYVPNGWFWPALASPAITTGDPASPSDLRGRQRFYVHIASRELGVAARCPIEVRLRYEFHEQTLGLERQEVLVTDVPTPCVAVPSNIAELRDLRAIELFTQGRFLGSIPWEHAQSATFTAKGGFLTLGSRSWTPFDEIKLEERLGRLMSSPYDSKAEAEAPEAEEVEFATLVAEMSEEAEFALPLPSVDSNPSPNDHASSAREQDLSHLP